MSGATPEPHPRPGLLDPEAAAAALASDDVLGPFVTHVGPVRMRPPGDGHLAALVRAITFQQLAGKAAATIHGRLVEALDGHVTAEAILAADDEDLRAAGLSANKAAAIRDLASKAAGGALRLDEVERLSDEEIVTRLTAVRGIGRWTAQMFLIFQLRRPDVWPTGDLGVRAGYARLHGLPEPPSPRDLEQLGERFRPWRSAAAWYCWRAMDTRLPEV